MASIENIITENIDVWSSAIKQRNTQGRGSSKKQELYGIQKLRELILDLAVRGLLAPQDPSDEPASVLLEKIAIEKEQLIKGKIIKQPRKTPNIRKEDAYYSLPKSWCWIRLADIGHDWGQKIPDRAFTYIDVGAINKERGFIDNPSQLEASEAPSRARKIVKNGTVIYSTVRPYLLNIAVVDSHIDPEPIASTAFAVIHPFKGIDAGYVYRYLRSSTFIQYVESCQTGIAYPAINDKQFFSGLIPVPPLEEQKRIVAKVDELMVLCDQLEQQQESSITAHQQLVERLLAALTQAADNESFEQAWSRIVANFETLFTTENSIDQLKQTLLQLAVMGKLVPQDPSDEPAEKLLARVDSYLCEALQVSTLNKMKRDKSVIEPSEFHTDLPSSWKWCELQDICLFLNGKAHEKIVQEYGRYILINSKFVSNSGEIRKHVSKRLTPLSTGDIAVVMSDVPNGRALARCYLVEQDNLYTLNQRIGGLITSPELNREYLMIVLDRHPYMLNYNDGKKQTNLKKIQVLSSPVPLAPLEEQKRIVEKVDQLFAICDQLKTKINSAQQTQLQLADAITSQAIQ